MTWTFCGTTARQIQAFASPQERQQWYAAVSRERTQRVQAYREKMVGRHSLWQEWRNGLPAGEELNRAVLKRFEIWAASLDPDPAHTQMVTQFSLELYDALQAGGRCRRVSAGVGRPPRSASGCRAYAWGGHGGRDKVRHKVCGRLLEKLESRRGGRRRTCRSQLWWPAIIAALCPLHKGAMQRYPPRTSISSIAWEEFCASPTAWTAGMTSDSRDCGQPNCRAHRHCRRRLRSAQQAGRKDCRCPSRAGIRV